MVNLAQQQMIPQQKKGLRQRIAERFYRPERMREVFHRMKQDAGFIPIFNVDDLEARREQIRKILTDLRDDIFDPVKGPTATKAVVQKTFTLFFCEGNMWYRGLDNRELAEKVKEFLEQCQDIGYMVEYHPDLFTEAMFLLNLSFQAIDVTNTPPYIIESRPVVTAVGPARAQLTRVDEYLAGNQEQISSTEN